MKTIEVTEEDLKELLEAYDAWSGIFPYEEQLDYLARFNHLRKELDDSNETNQI